MNEKQGSPSGTFLGKTFEEIDTLVRARYPILYLLTHEESRLEDFLLQLANRQSKKLMVWSATTGLMQRTGFGTVTPVHQDNSLNDPIEFLRAISQEESPGLYLLKDFHVFLEDPHIVRLLRDMVVSFKNSYKTLLIVSPRLNLPVELEKDASLIDIPLPQVEELFQLLESICSAVKARDPDRVKLNPTEMWAMAKAAQGLTLAEAENAFAKAVVHDAVLDHRDIDLIFKEKEQVIRKSGMLEFYPLDTYLGDVGGLDRLKHWLMVRGKAFTPQATKFGLATPKGVLLLGAPGCGKSLTAKAIARYWSMPLLRLDLGKVFAGLVGSSEENMRKALKLAESIAPTILWIDEIEKGFSGNSNGTSDAGTSARVFGTFLTWMQEKTAHVFVVATANKIAHLPPELLRRGRFDEIFFTDLPSIHARKEILTIHLKRRQRQVEKFDLEAIAAITEGFSGAELEHCVTEAMFNAFHERRDIRTEDVVRTAKETVPLSVVYGEELKALRQWAATRARPAETPATRVSAPAGSSNRMMKIESKPSESKPNDKKEPA